MQILLLLIIIHILVMLYLTDKNNAFIMSMQKYRINKLNENIIINRENQEPINLKLNIKHKIGEGEYSNVFHAYWEDINKCIALKSSDYNLQHKSFTKREINVLNYFANNIQIEQDRIIQMYGINYLKNKQKVFIALELGGNNLKNYFEKEIKKINVNKYNLINKIAKGVAQSIKQFHGHGDNLNCIHLDIKLNNFVLSQKQNQPNKEINLKIIDFNTSVVTSNKQIKTKVHGLKKFRAPEIRSANSEEEFNVNRKVDIWSFGLMIYGLLYENHKKDILTDTQALINLGKIQSGDYSVLDNELEKYRLNNELNSNLDKLIKACIQPQPNNRPNISQINYLLVMVTINRGTNKLNDLFKKELIEEKNKENKGKEKLEEEKKETHLILDENQRCNDHNIQNINDEDTIIPAEDIILYSTLKTIGEGPSSKIYHAYSINLKNENVTIFDENWEINKYIYIVLELEEKDLKVYIEENINNNFDNFVTKIAKAAAKALNQFHGKKQNIIHMDIKPGNFVLSKKQNNSEEIILKLIDFNSSIIIVDKEEKFKGTRNTNYNLNYEFPVKTNVDGASTSQETQKFFLSTKVDVWAFGLMLYELYKKQKIIGTPIGTTTSIHHQLSPLRSFSILNSPLRSPLIPILGDKMIEATESLIKISDEEINDFLSDKYANTTLDRVIKACLQFNFEIRSNMSEIVNFFDGYIKDFEFERRQEVLPSIDEIELEEFTIN
ncbi:Protein kinase domain-containing protein [Meloidogyne graminicola]|uniref:Protein kinase domain-containing protein n=1 Tax=Meloidogyne graminicola TaxID=189291 RepID=A0A8S9ZM11_9BILA|nr:Protein kinase domain-containing protein [Meloidogyne graminicola]